MVFAHAEEVEDLDDRRFVTAMNDGDACMLDIALLSSNLVREEAEALQTIIEMCVVFDAKNDQAFPTAEMLLEARSDFENAVRQELGIDRKKFVIEADGRLMLIARAVVSASMPLAGKPSKWLAWSHRLPGRTPAPCIAVAPKRGSRTARSNRMRTRAVASERRRP